MARRNFTTAINENRNSKEILYALSMVDNETKNIIIVEIIKHTSLAINASLRYELINKKNNKFIKANNDPDKIINFFITN
jgi:hypothetical protein